MMVALVGVASLFDFLNGLHGAQAVGTGVVDQHIIDVSVIFGALVNAIFWNLFTLGLPLPTSSSHVLVGDPLAQGVARSGFDLVAQGGIEKAVAASFMSPAIVLIRALMLVLAVEWASIGLTPIATDRRYRKLQLLSASLHSLG